MAHEIIATDHGLDNYIQIETYLVTQNHDHCSGDRTPIPVGMPRSKTALAVVTDLHDGPWDVIRFQFINNNLVNWTVEWSANTAKINPNCIAYWKYWRESLEKTHSGQYVVIISLDHDPVFFNDYATAIDYMCSHPGSYMHHVGNNCTCITHN